MKDPHYQKLRKETILQYVGRVERKKEPPKPISKDNVRAIRRSIINELEKAMRLGCHISIEHDPCRAFNFREGFQEYLNTEGKRIITITIEG